VDRRNLPSCPAFVAAALAPGGSLASPAFRTAASFSVGMTIVAVAAAGVRILPWLFDASVPWAVVGPFARALATVAAEAALLLGWPIGWALATARFVDRGEARVIELLGERPALTIARLLPQGVAVAALLGAIAVLGGRDAAAPGRIVNELVDRGRASCVSAATPTTYTVPFLNATWLCAPGWQPRLVAESPLGKSLVVAADARISGDFRRIELDDARFALGRGATTANVHVGTLTLRGLPPFAHASSLPPYARGLLVGASGLASAIAAAYLVLRRRVRARVVAVALGAAGPLAALGTLRFLERTDAVAWFVLLPLASLAGIVLFDVVRLACLLACGSRRR
jgi:hypothetical protein